MMPKAIPVTIANGQSLSGAIAIGDQVLIGIAMSAVWTAAGLTFQVSYDGGTTFQEFKDAAGADVAATVAAAQFIGINPAIWEGVTTLKVRSGTSGAPVAQGADRVLNLITKKLS